MDIILNDNSELDIKGAIALVYNDAHRGIVSSMGSLHCTEACKEGSSCDECIHRNDYIIVHLDNGSYLFHVLNDNVTVSNELYIGDSCVLNLKSNQNAVWERSGTRGPDPSLIPDGKNCIESGKEK